MKKLLTGMMLLIMFCSCRKYPEDDSRFLIPPELRLTNKRWSGGVCTSCEIYFNRSGQFHGDIFPFFRDDSTFTDQCYEVKWSFSANKRKLRLFNDCIFHEYNILRLEDDHLVLERNGVINNYLKKKRIR